MKRPLNSDSLGEKGERRFAELCADADLICNQSSRDRMGWDFIVEFPFPNRHDGRPLDSRPQPPECRAQVKTVWEGQKYIKMRLSCADRLAKYLYPTCIFVLTCKNDLTFEGIYGIHISDDVLSSILKKIRECEKSGRIRINREFIKIDFVKYGRRIPISGNNLKEFIESCSGPDREKYVLMKNAQISDLGVIGNRFAGSFTLETPLGAVC